MFKLLIDTSVWLDLAKDTQQASLLSALEELVRLNKVGLLLPQIVIEEFRRNKQRVLEENKKSMASTLKRARRLLEEVGPQKGKTAALRLLDDASYKMPTLQDTANSSVHRIERLMKKFPALISNDEILLRAANRAMEGKAPFHTKRNSIADAIIVETYIQTLQAKGTSGERFAFITHNVKDFSDPNGDRRLPHPDLATIFTRKKSLYFVTLKEALRRIEPHLLAEQIFEEEWMDEPRGVGEISDSIGELLDKIWYNRHQVRASYIKAGKIKIIPKEEWTLGNNNKTIVDEIWKGALQAAEKVERKYGRKNVGPWDDFEWGMLNGKLSALRWVLGDEWDMLDT